MTSAAEHLKSIPVFFINVDGHTEREERFMRETAPWFLEAYRVPAVPIVDVVAEANDFTSRIAWSREHGDPRGFFAKFPKIYTSIELEYRVRRTNQVGNLVYPFYFREGGVRE